LDFADAIPEICHAIEIAVNRNWGKDAVWLIRSSISPMIAFGQFSSLDFLEKIMEKEIKLSSRERVVLLGGLAKIKLWRNDHQGAIQLLDSVISFGFPTESVNAARTLAQVYLDEGDMDAAEKHLALAHSILKELPPGYPYPTEELWSQYYEGLGNYYLHTSQAQMAYDAFTHAQEFAVEHVGWTNHITNLIARCLLTLGDFEQTLTLLSSFPEDNNAEFSLHSVERNLIRAECHWRIGNSEQAKKNLMSTEAMLHGVLEQPGLESHLATLNRLHNFIDQEKNEIAQ
jgi:tetratricopeptide (TPR) repeat protein